MNFLNYLKQHLFIIIYGLIFFFFSQQIWGSVTSAFGILNILERIFYYTIQLNLLFFIILYFIFINNDIEVWKKILYTTISTIYYLMLASYIAFNIWQNDDFILECLKYLIIQLIFIFIICKAFRRQRLFSKKIVISSIYFFSALIFASFSYSYYQHYQLIEFCKRVKTEEGTIKCLRNLDYKRVGYSDNMIIGKDAAFLFTYNPDFKKQAEKIKDSTIIIDGDEVKWQ